MQRARFSKPPSQSRERPVSSRLHAVRGRGLTPSVASFPSKTPAVGGPLSCLLQTFRAAGLLTTEQVGLSRSLLVVRTQQRSAKSSPTHLPLPSLGLFFPCSARLCLPFPLRRFGKRTGGAKTTDSPAVLFPSPVARVSKAAPLSQLLPLKKAGAFWRRESYLSFARDLS